MWDSVMNALTLQHLCALCVSARDPFFEVPEKNHRFTPSNSKRIWRWRNFNSGLYQLRAGNDERRNHAFVNGLPRRRRTKSSRRASEGAEKKCLSFSSGIGVALGATTKMWVTPRVSAEMVSPANRPYHVFDLRFNTRTLRCLQGSPVELLLP